MTDSVSYLSGIRSPYLGLFVAAAASIIIILLILILEYFYFAIPRSRQQKNIPPPLCNNEISTNLSMLQNYYGEVLREFQASWRACIVVAIIGFIMILIGIGLLYSQKLQTIGIISGVAGVIAEAFTILFFRHNQSIQEHIEEDHKKLVSTQYLNIAISLANELKPELKEKEISNIIDKLLCLSSGLHGCPPTQEADKHKTE
ncbi:MAG: hypothetical protein N3B21_06435 [Clostridia bacterium]|nr:hypothetical protein [Clostridia bacterium]